MHPQGVVTEPELAQGPFHNLEATHSWTPSLNASNLNPHVLIQDLCSESTGWVIRQPVGHLAWGCHQLGCPWSGRSPAVNRRPRGVSRR